MDVRIRATDFQISPAVSDYLQPRLDAIERMLGDDAALARCEVELSRSGGAQRHGEYVWRAEIQVTRPGGERIVARNQEATVNAAIDQAKDEVMAQLRGQKKSNMRVLRKTGAAIKRWMRFG